jgi:hypothetical protein
MKLISCGESDTIFHWTSFDFWPSLSKLFFFLGEFF